MTGPAITSVRLRTHDEERDALLRLTRAPYGIVLAVSDLHLGVGREPVTGTYPMNESFVADDAFARFLEHGRLGAQGARLLILNGDTFDFLRVPRCPMTDGDYERWRARLIRLGERERAERLERPVSDGEQKFGLKTHDYKTIWKLLLMEEGHGPFFDALSAWVAGGGRLIVVKGNHDLELYWPLVRRAVRDALVLHGATPAAVEEAVVFADEGFTVDNVYVEHGHQYERMTQVRGSPVLAGRPAEINYPLGSFINRYFINRIELLDPFIQNRKPSEQALLALLRQRPVAIVKIYTGGWKFVVRAFAQVRTRQGALAVLLSLALVVPVVTLGLIATWLVFPGVRAWLLERLPFLQLRWLRIGGSVGGSLFPALLPYLLGAAREVLKDVGIVRATDTLAAAAPGRLAEQFPAATSPRCVYAVMGHTHVQTVERLPDSSRRALYVNTGTWTALWPLDRPDLAGRIIYSVTRFRRQDGEYRLEALEWNDDAGEARAGRILVSA